MRPVTRGVALKTYARYQDAIGDLEDSLDRYCSYCERRFPVSLAVEHVVPKSVDKARERDWNNFLLGCVNCNSVKAAKPTNDVDFVWPDRDNTLRAIEYEAGGLVSLAPDFPPEMQTKITNLIDLVGLDRHPGQPANKQPASRDSRYSDREEVWKLAEKKRDALIRNNNNDFRETITEIAQGFGFFSVWMSVFSDDRDMRCRFFAAFKGTAKDCFDDEWNYVLRPGGQL